MRILWFTNSPSCYAASRNSYNGGGWIASAEKMFHSVDGLELAVSFALDGQPFKSESNGVCYYPIPSPKISKITKYIKDTFGGEEYERKSWEYWIGYFEKIIADFKPDLIHVWGSEMYFGLVHKITNLPIVLHIQGVLNPYLNAYLPPFVSWKQYRWQSLSPKKLAINLRMRRLWQRGSIREKEIFGGIKNFLGRTSWDERIAYVLNPKSRYFHVDEILRDSFYQTKSREIPDRLTIVTTISQPLYKGFDLVLKTAKLLKENLKLDFEWKCFGNINPAFVEKIVGIQHQDVNVKLMGVATQNQLAAAELEATLYFHPSYIDNSPNSLCEAQMLGLPVIATNVGGITTLVDEGETGFLVPSNDPYQAAYLIEKLHIDKALNKTFGENARTIALKRHSPESVKSQILGVYREVLK